MSVRCPRIEGQLAAYCDGGLPRGREREIAAHLRECAACRAELALLRDSMHLLERVRPARPAEDLWSATQARIAAVQSPAVLACDRVEERMPVFLEGGLSAEERGAVAHHLAACAQCAADERALNRSLQLLDRVRPCAPPPDLWQRLEARLRAPERRPAWIPPRIISWQTGGLAAGLAAAVAALALLSGQRAGIPVPRTSPGLVRGQTPQPYAPGSTQMVERGAAYQRELTTERRHPDGEHRQGMDRSRPRPVAGGRLAERRLPPRHRTHRGPVVLAKASHQPAETMLAPMPVEQPVVIVSQQSMQALARSLAPVGETLERAPNYSQLMSAGEDGDAVH
jgi:anti-sigma factor RsiW